MVCEDGDPFWQVRPAASTDWGVEKAGSEPEGSRLTSGEAVAIDEASATRAVMVEVNFILKRGGGLVECMCDWEGEGLSGGVQSCLVQVRRKDRHLI